MIYFSSDESCHPMLMKEKLYHYFDEYPNRSRFNQGLHAVESFPDCSY